MKKILVVALVVALALIGAQVVFAAAHGTNCVTCHTPHNAAADAVLWRSSATGTGLITAVRPGSTATANSVLCMSCHALIARGPGMNSGDLTNDHPLKTAAVGNTAGVLPGVVAQCNTCHNVHNGVVNYVAGACATCHTETGANW